MADDRHRTSYQRTTFYTRWCNKIELKITVLTIIYLKLIKTIYVTAGLKYQTLLITLNCFTKNVIIITINVLNGVVFLI